MRVPKHRQLTDREGGRQDIRDGGLQLGQCRQLAACQVDRVWGAAQVTALAGGASTCFYSARAQWLLWGHFTANAGPLKRVFGT